VNVLALHLLNYNSSRLYSATRPWPCTLVSLHLVIPRVKPYPILIPYFTTHVSSHWVHAPDREGRKVAIIHLLLKSVRLSLLLTWVSIENNFAHVFQLAGERVGGLAGE
jgi:hypothetical protein